MHKQGRLLILALFSTMLTACVGEIWTGANMIYDRHNTYKTLSSYKLTGDTGHALFADRTLKCKGCALDVAIFRDKILLSGHVPTLELKTEAHNRLASVAANSKIYNRINIDNAPANTLNDTWITTKIRMQVLADSSVDPNSFKVITSDGIVYLLGEMKKDQAEKLIDIARNTVGVLKVVKMIQYFTYVG